MAWDTDTITRLIEVEAQLQGVDPRLAVAVAQQESNLRPDNPGDNGKSRGVFHLQERAAMDAGIDPKQRDDPAIGIFAGVKYLKQQLDKSGGHIPQALSRYNRGTPDYRGIGDPDYVYHVMRHYPGGHPLGKEPTDQEAYRARLNKTFGAGTAGPADKPGLLTRAANALSPASAEAATPPATGRSRLEEIEAELARREGQTAPQTPPQTIAPPTARSTPEQDAAYRASRGQQEPPPVSQAPPTPPTQPGASQGPLAPHPDPSPTPGMRFQALPSITQLELADRMQKTKLFESLQPDLQEEFLRSEEPTAGGLAVGGAPVAQSQPVTDPAALLAMGRGPQRPAPAPAPAPSQPPPTGPVRPVGLTRLTPEMDDDAILHTLGYDPALVKQSKLYRPGNLQAHITDPKSLWGQIADSPLGGIARGARDPLDALIQMGSRGLAKTGLLNQADVAYLDVITKMGEADYQQNIRKGRQVDPETGQPGMFSDPSRLVGNAAILPIPGGAATTIPRTIARGAATGAVAGALQPVVETSPQPGSQADDFLTQKGVQAGVGGLTGGVLSPIMERGVAPAVNKAINWGRGVMAPAHQALVDLGERYGVRLSYGDVTGGSVAPKVESVLEAIPGSGAGRMRVGQQADVTRAGEAVRTGLQTEMQATPWRNLPAVQRAAGQGDRQAQALLVEINQAGDDWGHIIQASGKLNLWQDRQRSQQLYGRVARLAQPLGNMPVPRAVQAMDAAVDDVAHAVLPAPELQREVHTLMTRARQEITPNAAGAVPDTTYARMQRLSDDLGDMQRTATEPRTARYLGQVKRALEEDMRTFAQQSNVPALVRAHRQADQFYRTRIVPYREGQLAKAIEADLPDEIYGKFVRRGADRARFFYRGLDPRGQAAVRYGMVQEALTDAASPTHPDVFSPARFVSSMRRIQDASDVFFQGQPQWEINGITNLMQHAQRAGQYAENPPTGWRAAIGTGMFSVASLANLPAVIGGLLQAQGLRGLLMTPRGRNFLLAASDLEPGSPAFQRALDQFMRQVPRAAAARGGQQADQPSQ